MRSSMRKGRKRLGSLLPDKIGSVKKASKPILQNDVNEAPQDHGSDAEDRAKSDVATSSDAKGQDMALISELNDDINIAIRKTTYVPLLNNDGLPYGDVHFNTLEHLINEHLKNDVEHLKNDVQEHLKNDVAHLKNDDEHSNNDVEHLINDTEHLNNSPALSNSSNVNNQSDGSNTGMGSNR